MVRTYLKSNASSLGMFDEALPRQKLFAPDKNDMLQHHQELVSSTTLQEMPYPSSYRSAFSPPKLFANEGDNDVWVEQREFEQPVFVLPRPQELLQIGLCQNCRRLFPTNHERSKYVDYEDILNQKRREESNYRRADPFLVKSSASEGFLSHYARGNQDFSHADAAVQEPPPETLQSHLFGPFQSYPGTAGATTTTQFADQGQRDSWSAPIEETEKSDPKTTESQAADYRLRRQFAAAAANPLGDDAVIRTQRYLDHRSDGGGGYSPSVYDGTRSGKRSNGTIILSLHDPESYQRELQQQMAEQAARRERDKKHDHLDWWEKKPVFASPESPIKPHPSQRSESHPLYDRKVYEEELRRQMEAKKRQQEELRLREREEEERLERRFLEQQARIKAEFDEEQNKKRAKEEAKLRRQETLARKQQEMQLEAVRSRKAEIASHHHHHQEADAHTSSSSSSEGTYPHPEPQQQQQQQSDEQSEEQSETSRTDFRSNSPPVPSLREKIGPR